MDLLRSDLESILDEIRVMEAFNAAVAAFPTAANNFSQPTLEEQRVIMLGLVGNVPGSTAGIRTTSGVLNNLTPGNATFGAADQPFISLTKPTYVAGNADTNPTLPGVQGFDPDGPTGPAPAITNADYTPNAAAGNNVVDSQPRQISQLISDQSTANPAAVAASVRTGGGIVMYTGPIIPEEELPGGRGIYLGGNGSLYNAAGQVVDEVGNPMLTVLNNAPDGVSAPYNSWLTLFGQGFDHGLDHINKGGNGKIYIPLLPGDPLYDPEPGARTNFMVVTRAALNAVNTTTPWVDMNQAYGSNPSFQVFLREYTLVDGKPVATGKLLGGATGGMPTWADIKLQAAEMLGIQLTDEWVGDSPQIVTDQFGRFIPDDANGMPQVEFTTATPGVFEYRSGTAAAPLSLVGAEKTGHAFLLDIAHTAAPGGGKTADDDDIAGNPQAVDPRTGRATTYDNELLEAHFIAGDGRVNENSGLTTFHTIFHNEHDRLVVDYKRIALESGDIAFINEWLNTPITDLTQAGNGSGLNWNGERLFQAARFMVEMQYQHGVFEEFSRFIQPNLNLFGGVNTDLNPDITREFAHAVYRFGHSMLNETVDRVTLGPNGEWIDNSTSLIKAFLDPLGFLRQSGDPDSTIIPLTPEQAAGEVLRGMTRQQGNDIDEFVTGALHNNLVGLPIDLGAINMARARELGMPRFNQVRRELYQASGQDARLTPYGSWADFAAALKHPESIYNFVAAYGTHELITSQTSDAGKRAAAIALLNGTLVDFVEGGVIKRLPALPNEADALAFLNGTGLYEANKGGLELVDFWIGGLAEKGLAANDMLGSSFAYVFETQLENLQSADRHYYLVRLSGNLLTQIEQTSFADMAQRNVAVNHLPGNIFSTPTWTLEVNAAFQHTGLGNSNREDPTGQVGLLPLVSRSAIGNLAGRAGIAAENVLFYNGEDHVVLGGTEQNDLLWASNGDDTIYGGAGDDIIYSGGGDDVVWGGVGDDIIFDGGAGAAGDVIRSGDGNDVTTLSAGLAFVFGGNGKDMVIGASSSAEVFGNADDDFILLGRGGGLAQGGAGDDWLEGGGSGDSGIGEDGRGQTLTGNGQEIGHDVFVLGDGDDRADGELGDDIFIDGGGEDRYFGDAGFDWVTFGRDVAPRELNLGAVIPINPPPGLILGDRFDGNVEAISGTRFDDFILGDNRSDLGGVIDNRLTSDHFALISGLFSNNVADGALINANMLNNRELFDATGALSFGNIMLGGGGADSIQGNGGNEIIDGDLELTVQIEWRPSPNDSTTWRRFDSVAQLQAAASNRVVNPGDLYIVRELRSADNNQGDVAVFRGASQEYDIEGFDLLTGTAQDIDGDGYIRIAHNALVVEGGALGATFDGIDYMRNVEFLSFVDAEFSVTGGQSTLVSGFADDTTPLTVRPEERISFQQNGSRGGIGLTFSTIEAVGNFGLDSDQNGGVWITNTGTLNRLKLTHQGQHVTIGQFAGWSPVGVRSINDLDAAFEIVWSGNKSVSAWKVNRLGEHVSNAGLTKFQVAERESFFGQDINGVGGIHPAAINNILPVYKALTSGGPSLWTDSLNRYSISQAGQDVTLKYNWGGVRGIEEVDSSAFVGWSAMAVAQFAESTNKTVLWGNGTGDYSLWEVDTDGNYMSHKVLSDYEAASMESTFKIDLNANGTIGSYLGENAQGYTLGNVALMLNKTTQAGSSTFTGWSAVAAASTAAGNQVAWRNSSGTFSIWDTDKNGNYLSHSVVNNVQIGAYEYLFAEDLNGNGDLDSMRTIESLGTTSVIADLNGGFALSSDQGVHLLKINGIQVNENTFKDWKLAGAEDTITGYQVVWGNASTGSYSYWNTDASGNFLSFKIADATAIKAFEASFLQDLNQNGNVDVLTRVETPGSTASLLQQSIEDGGGYFIEGANGIQILSIQGTQVTADLFAGAGWSLDRVDIQGSGYSVNWLKDGGTAQSIWTTNSRGDYQSHVLA